MNRTWLFRIGYLVAALFILGLEIVAIVDDSQGNTITENTRLVIESAPFAWFVTLGATVGLLAWLIPHFWWRRK